jgi:Zn-dependent membrane protease YugP
MFYFDPMYFLFLAPALLLGMWAQWRVKSAYAKASQLPARSGMTGAEAAYRILETHGLSGVAIEPTHGFLGDHYDPRHKVLRLSPDVYSGRSLASVGIAAHEAGHAIQDRVGYAPLKLRNGIVPLASIGSNLSWVLVIGGMAMQWMGLTLAGIGLFSLVVLFQLINLPVEFDASNRAKDVLVRQGIIAPAEEAGVRRVLSAAALTYVAATLTAILTLVYFLFRAGLLGGRRD